MRRFEPFGDLHAEVTISLNPKPFRNRRAQVMICMMLVEHVIACFWFGLGTADGGHETWLSRNFAAR